MSRQWTDDQKRAISSTGGTVLVAAAAGSGKTSVLVERVIGRITDEKKPTDLDKFLIVTFTTSAAREMKDRISERLSTLISKNPENLNFHRQQMLLKSAQIGTIHSFCNSVVKENFFRLGISPNFKIGTDSEIYMIKEKALENTFEYFYSYKKEEFTKVLDTFSGEKNTQNLENIIKSLSQFMDSLAFPEIWLEKTLKLYERNSDFENKNAWADVIIEYLANCLDYAVYLMEDSLKMIGKFEDLKKSYFETFENELSLFKEIKENLGSLSWNEIAEKINNFSFSRLKPCRAKENEAYKNEVTMKRNSAKKVISDLKKYFVFESEDISRNMDMTYEMVKTLCEVTFHFKEEIWNLKLLKNMLDFSDLEKLTLKVLVDDPKSLKKSKVAKEICERFTEIMVDEYQDINEVQDTIFKLITKNENNLFMVGDVKQSIYKFRQSRPKIFLKKKNFYPTYDEGKDNYPSKIILGKNFRSKKTIIDSVNLIFKCLMSEKVGEISYSYEEELLCGANYENSKGKDVSLKLVIGSDEEESSVLEAREIAKTIMQLISSGYKIKKGDTYRNVTYSDFCVLLRKSNSFAHIYANELNLCGIPSWTETNDKFLTTTEVSTILSLLKVIDNVIDDIPLISCMMSPLFGFSIDEVSRVRSKEKNLPFYFALKASSEDSPKLKNFLENINHFRKMSGTMSCSELIDLIYETTKYPDICLALQNGNIKKANLLLLKDYAKKFDEDLSKGLSGFLGFIKSLERKNSDLPSASISSEADNTVKIMSIHKSKGLEFPICIVSGCSKKFNKDNFDIVIHPDLGLGTKLKSKTGLSKRENLIFSAINLKNENENISEEMRILYVALTRAKQKLILIACEKDTKKIAEKCLLIQSFSEISPYLVRSSDSFLDWILIVLCFSSMKDKLFEVLGIKDQILKNSKIIGNVDWDIELLSPLNFEDETDEISGNIPIKEKTEKFNPELFEKIKKVSSYEYPHKNLAKFPIKMTASKLSHSGEWQNYFASSLPAFMSSSNTGATARGNAMHKFMCLSEIGNASENLEKEIARLLNKGLLSENEANLLNKKWLKEFLNSNLCKRILKSEEVLKEHRFSVKMSIEDQKPEKISKNETSVVVQGAMDCAFKEGEKYVIVDYKTDKANSIEELYEKYISQLKIYKYALEETKGIEVKEIGIYSFYLSQYLS